MFNRDSNRGYFLYRPGHLRENFYLEFFNLFKLDKSLDEIMLYILSMFLFIVLLFPIFKCNHFDVIESNHFEDKCYNSTSNYYLSPNQNKYMRFYEIFINRDIVYSNEIVKPDETIVFCENIDKYSQVFILWIFMNITLILFIIFQSFFGLIYIIKNKFLSDYP